MSSWPMGAFEWDDLGSWNALGRHLKSRCRRKLRRGRFHSRRCGAKILFMTLEPRTGGHPLPSWDWRDSILVQTDDATLLAHKSQAPKK